MALSSVPLQHVLFLVPYLNIAFVAGFLLLTADNPIALLLGIQMISFLFLYLIGLMGNHYIKVYCFLSNMLYMAVFLLMLMYGWLWSGTSFTTTLIHFRIPQLFLTWWIPQIGMLLYVLVVPSINEILPNQLYLGNLAAASTPALLEELNITHILELHDDRKKNDPSQVKQELLQLCCSDLLGSEQSLIKVAPEAIEFMDNVFLKDDNRLLVHCAAGGSRSPAMIVHWLVTSGREKRVVDAVQTVRRGRPFVDISSDHLRAIQSHHDENQAAAKQQKKTE